MMMDKQALEIVRNLQKLRGINGEYDSDINSGVQVGRRRTIANIAKGQRKTNIGTLDVAFKKRFFSFSAENQQEDGDGKPLKKY